MHSKLLFTIGSSLLVALIVVILWLFSINYFNPITDKKWVEGTHSILKKLEQYETRAPIADKELPYSYQLNIGYTKKELALFEGGLHVTREYDGYKVAIPQGFDNTVYYLQLKDCWYSYSKPIIGLPICAQ